MQHTETQPEDGEESAHHHGEEVAHYPLEDDGEDEKHRADEEEDSAAVWHRVSRHVFSGRRARDMHLHDGGQPFGAAPAHHDHGEGHGRYNEAIRISTRVLQLFRVVGSPNEAQRRWIGKASDVVTRMRDLGSEVEL